MTMQRKVVRGMNPEELAALNDWANTMRRAAPQMRATATAAKTITEAMIGAPVWRMAEGTPEFGHQKPTNEDPWKIGAPKVNYVEHIETIGDSERITSDEREQS